MRLVRGHELSAPLGGGLRLHDGILVLIEGPDRFLVCIRSKAHRVEEIRQRVFTKREGRKKLRIANRRLVPVVAFKVPLRSI